MLETRFPRPLGDIGNPASFTFPVRYKLVRGASPERVVRERAAGLLDPFIGAARELIDEGCNAITTSCGFLVLFQDALAATLPVAVMTSCLLQLPAIEKRLTPGKRAGVLTIDSASLTQDHLAAAGACVDTPIEGTESGVEFTRHRRRLPSRLHLPSCRTRAASRRCRGPGPAARTPERRSSGHRPPARRHRPCSRCDRPC